MKTLVLTIAALLFLASTAIYTANRPVAMSGLKTGFPGSNAVDNNFDNYCHTANTEVPWVNI